MMPTPSLLSTAFDHDRDLAQPAASPAARRADPKRLSIAHVVNTTCWGGMEARTLETAEWQRAHGHDVVIVTPAGGALQAAADRRNLAVEAVDFCGASKLENLKQIRRAFRRRGVRVADFHTNRSLALGVRDLATLVRSQHILRQPKQGGLKLNKEFPFDGFILSSDGGRDVLVENGYARAARVSVVGEWAQERFFSSEPSPATLRLQKRRLGLPADALVIGAVAMLRPDNAFDELIRATARLHRLGVPAHCLVVGGSMDLKPGPCAQEIELRRLAAELGVEDHIHFLGHRTDVPELLSVMDVVAVVSRHTAQTRVGPEAAARARAVVAFDVGALGETIRHGETGLLSPLGHRESFTLGLLRLLTDPDERSRLARNAGRLARTEFRQSGKMELTLEAYRAAMARRAGRFGVVEAAPRAIALVRAA